MNGGRGRFGFMVKVGLVQVYRCKLVIGRKFIPFQVNKLLINSLRLKKYVYTGVAGKVTDLF